MPCKMSRHIPLHYCSETHYQLTWHLINALFSYLKLLNKSQSSLNHRLSWHLPIVPVFSDGFTKSASKVFQTFVVDEFHKSFVNKLILCLQWKKNKLVDEEQTTEVLLFLSWSVWVENPRPICSKCLWTSLLIKKKQCVSLILNSLFVWGWSGSYRVSCYQIET